MHGKILLKNKKKILFYMPLSKGKSKKVISKNIEKLRNEDYPAKQAVAIAFSKARQSGAKIPKKKIILFLNNFFYSLGKGNYVITT